MVYWNVVLMVYNMLAVHVLRLDLGVISISHVIVGLTGVLQGYPRLTFFRHFAGEGHRGFLEDVRVAILDQLYGNRRQRKSFFSNCQLLNLSLRRNR